jgi:hypothetical protein
LTTEANAGEVWRFATNYPMSPAWTGSTSPLSREARIARINVEYSPCFKRVCPLGHLRCLNDLSPDVVWAGLEEARAKTIS